METTNKTADVFLGYDTFVCEEIGCAGITLVAAIKANPNAKKYTGLRGEVFDRLSEEARAVARAEFAPMIPKCECGKVTV